MAITAINTSFTTGELAPSLFGHVDLARGHTAASTMRNMFVSYRGGAYSRAGTKFVGMSKQTGRNYPCRLIPFQFSINQGLVLEFGNYYMRVISNGAYVVENPTTITGITQASPAGTVTDPNHGYNSLDWVVLDNIVGMTQLNGRTVVVWNIQQNSYEISNAFGAGIDTSTFSAYVSGGTASRIYTVATPYAEQDLPYLKFAQSADVMSICCWNQQTGTSYPPYELSRQADNNWTLAPLSVSVAIAPPASLSGYATMNATSPPTSYSYVVTAVDSATGQESTASTPVYINDSVNIGVTAGTEVIYWPSVVNSDHYNIYKTEPATNGSIPVGALYGYVGLAYGVQFVDTNILADYSQVPPLHKNPFAVNAVSSISITNGGSNITAISWAVTTSTGGGFNGYPVLSGATLVDFVITNGGENYQPSDSIHFTVNVGAVRPLATLVLGPSSGTYPSVVSYFQERRVYASSPNNPDTYFMSQPGNFLNFDSRTPTIASDAIVGTPWSVQVNGIQFMVPMIGGLVVLTGSSAWQVTGAGGSALNPVAITPSSQQAQPQAFNGCSALVPPIKINNEILYVQAKGSILRDLSYTIWLNTYTGIDLTQLSSHLFTGYTIKEMCYCEEPFKVVWAVRNDGVLLSLTFLKEQEVAGWARHDTFGLFQSVCSVTEPPADALYTCVWRYQIYGFGYFVERMDNRIWGQAEDCWCVDCGVQLPQGTRNATLFCSSANGLGAVTGTVELTGGSGYSSATTATVVDNNGRGSGAGAIPSLTISNGVITAVSFVSGQQGTNYTNPQLVINDPTGGGSGALAILALSNAATVTASGDVFSSADIGSVIRMGGGVLAVTDYISAHQLAVNILSPIVAVLPEGGTILPQAPGNWTITQPTNTVEGLDYLSGAVVTGLADGNVIPPTLVPVSGVITIPTPATAITIGLGFQAQLQTTYLDSGAPTTQGQVKRISRLTARMETSRGIMAGTNQVDGSTMSPMQLAPAWTELSILPDLITVNNAPPLPYNGLCLPLYTGDRRIPLIGGFEKPAQAALQQSNPLPMQVLAIIPEWMPGDMPQMESGSSRGKK